MQFVNALLAIIVAALFIFFAPVLGVAFGGFAGWVVGLFFPDTLGLLSSWLGITAEPYQIGAGLGFLSGFLIKKPS